MPSGFQTTIDLLATTRNQSAADVLLHALETDDLPTQKRALDGLLRRRSPAALRKVVASWHTFSAKLKDVTLQHRGRLAQAIRDAILSRNDQLCANGCDAALVSREFDIVLALIAVVRSNETTQAELASRTILELVQLLQVEVEQSRNSRARRASQLARTRVCSSLEAAVRQFPQHGRKDILTAFLTIAGRDNATLNRILREPLDGTHAAVVELLAQSPRPAIARLLTSYLEDPRAPQAVLNVLSERRDDLFVQHFLRTVGEDLSPEMCGNLKRLTQFGWLQSGVSQMMFLDERAQVALALAVGHSGLPHGEILRVLKEVLAHGKLRARRVAANLLNDFQGVEANRLVMQALRDSDVPVQAAALSQLRERGLPGAMATLIEALESPHPFLRETARNCLSEFDLPRYLNAYDGMSEEVRLHTGQLVGKVDANAVPLLAEEMHSASRGRRLRAINVAQSLDLISDLEAPLLDLLADDDHMVRTAAAEALGQCPTEKTRLALRTATLDDSPAVRSAAERALDDMVVAAAQRTVAPRHVQPPAKSGPEQGGRSW